MLIWYTKDKGVSTRLIKDAYDFKIEFCYFLKNGAKNIAKIKKCSNLESYEGAEKKMYTMN